MKLEFAKYTDITKFAKETEPEKYNDYNRVLICPDVNTFWIARVLEGYNKEYEREEGSFLLERSNIDKYSAKMDLKKYTPMVMARKALEEDDLSNWDFEVCNNEDEAIEMLDDGFGIIDEV